MINKAGAEQDAYFITIHQMAVLAKAKTDPLQSARPHPIKKGCAVLKTICL